jgi:hypothetical protein
MLRQAVPQFRARSGSQRVGSYADNPGPVAAAKTILAVLEEEIDTAQWPIHSTTRFCERAFAANAALQLIQMTIEPDDIVNPVHFPTVISIACRLAGPASAR